MNNVKDLLDYKYEQYNQKDFIALDPVSIPHQFTRKEDIEIAAFLSATIAWGNRKSIIKNAQNLMELMDDSPYDFVINHTKKDLKKIGSFVHRTFNGTDCSFFIQSLQNIYINHQGLESVFSKGIKSDSENIKNAIVHFRDVFLNVKHLQRTEKHISNPYKNSSAKRLCMFLRWMVRNDKRGVDFGIWGKIKPSQLCLPLDVHTGNVARKLGLLQRKQDDWRAVEELTACLIQFDSIDPVKYDFALFGIGVNHDL